MVNKIGMIILIALVFIVAIIYINLEKERKNINQISDDLENFLKKRWNLVPKVIEIVGKYFIYDEKTLEKLTIISKSEFNDMKIDQKLDVNKNITKVILKMFQIAEKYTDLKSDEEYININNQFDQTENNIIKSIKDYNDEAKKYNLSIQKFPNNMVAILFGFNDKMIFEYSK